MELVVGLLARVTSLFTWRLLVDPEVDMAIELCVALGRCVAVPMRVRALRAAVVVYPAYVHHSVGVGLAS